jgi:hypothetical protein
MPNTICLKCSSYIFLRQTLPYLLSLEQLTTLLFISIPLHFSYASQPQTSTDFQASPNCRAHTLPKYAQVHSPTSTTPDVYTAHLLLLQHHHCSLAIKATPDVYGQIMYRGTCALFLSRTPSTLQSCTKATPSIRQIMYRAPPPF